MAGEVSVWMGGRRGNHVQLDRCLIEIFVFINKSGLDTVPLSIKIIIMIINLFDWEKERLVV
jgi:hypothetical protein